MVTATEMQKQLGHNPKPWPLGPVSFPKHPPATGGCTSRGTGPELGGLGWQKMVESQSSKAQAPPGTRASSRVTNSPAQ